MELLEGLRVP